MSEDTNTTQDEPEGPVEVVPFTREAMGNKDGLWRHLREMHHTSRYNLYNGSKATVDELTLHHDALHEDAAKPGHEQRWHGRHGFVHEHMILSPEDMAAAAGALEKVENPLGTPLNAKERSSLQALVDNDFAVLRAEIDQFAADMTRQRIEEIEQEYADKETLIAEYVGKVRDIAASMQAALGKVKDDHSARLVKLSEEAKKQGIEVGIVENDPTRITNGHLPAVNVMGKKEAIEAAKAEIEGDKNRARNTLERNRLQNVRRILMLGVSQRGLEVIEEMPDARSLMLKSAEESGQQKAAINA